MKKRFKRSSLKQLIHDNKRHDNKWHGSNYQSIKVRNLHLMFAFIKNFS